MIKLIILSYLIQHAKDNDVSTLYESLSRNHTAYEGSTFRHEVVTCRYRWVTRGVR